MNSITKTTLKIAALTPIMVFITMGWYTVGNFNSCSQVLYDYTITYSSFLTGYALYSLVNIAVLTFLPQEKCKYYWDVIYYLFFIAFNILCLFGLFTLTINNNCWGTLYSDIVLGTVIVQGYLVLLFLSCRIANYIVYGEYDNLAVNRQSASPTPVGV